MKGSASFTAALAAVARGLGRLLPEDARLIDDPFGERFATGSLERVARVAPRLPWLFESTLVTMQVRTSLIDEALVSFVTKGGRQVLVLGAGFDARALRFARELFDTRVFEVDHPATQARKREALPEAAEVRYLPWDFEAQPVSALPDALRGLGHDTRAPTLTIWEGVTMYLSEPAIDETVRAVATLSAPGSRFVLTYIERAAIERPGRLRGLVARVVAGVGEPLCFGFAPDELSAWLGDRGFNLEHDVTFQDAAGLLLPPRYPPMFDPSLRIAFAARSVVGGSDADPPPRRA